jgi:hypothetical protein
MKYPKSSLLVAITTFGVFLGVIFQEDLFSAFLFVLMGLGVMVPLTLIIGLVAFGFLLARRQIGKLLSFSLVVGFSSIFSLFCFMQTGSLLNKWKVDAVWTYVARAVPVLDRIKQEKGSYPSKLPVDLLGEEPELLRYYGDYTATPSTFRFEYVDEPAEWAGGEGLIEFDNVGRKWTDAQ